MARVQNKSGLLPYTFVQTVLVNFSWLVEINLKKKKKILVVIFQRSVTRLQGHKANYTKHSKLTCQFDLDSGPRGTHNAVFRV